MDENGRFPYVIFDKKNITKRAMVTWQGSKADVWWQNCPRA